MRHLWDIRDTRPAHIHVNPTLRRLRFTGHLWDIYGTYETDAGQRRRSANPPALQVGYTEAIVNAVTHRDYASNASVQVMLFSDRLEVWNPGELPSVLTLAELRRPHAPIPRNPLIAEPMFLARYAEKAGSGILEMIARCCEAGLPASEFRQSGGQFIQTLGRPRSEATPEVTPEDRLVRALVGEMTRQQLQRALGLRDDEQFRKAYLQPALDAGLIEMTIPNKPRSSRQKYRVTAEGDKKGTKGT